MPVKLTKKKLLGKTYLKLSLSTKMLTALRNHGNGPKSLCFTGSWLWVTHTMLRLQTASKRMRRILFKNPVCVCTQILQWTWTDHSFLSAFCLELLPKSQGWRQTLCKPKFKVKVPLKRHIWGFFSEKLYIKCCYTLFATHFYKKPLIFTLPIVHHHSVSVLTSDSSLPAPNIFPSKQV